MTWLRKGWALNLGGWAHAGNNMDVTLVKEVDDRIKKQIKKYIYKPKLD